jgi:hypothetical protein
VRELAAEGKRRGRPRPTADFIDALSRYAERGDYDPAKKGVQSYQSLLRRYYRAKYLHLDDLDAEIGVCGGE